MNEKTVYFIRHAQSLMSDSVPHEHWPLSEFGKNQAQKVVPLLQSLKIQKIYSSPYLRCRDTVAPFVDTTKLPIDFHDDLREQRLLFGWMDDFNDHWARVWNDFHYALPNCETAHQAQSRFVTALLNICQNSSESILGISTHGAVIGLFLNHLSSHFNLKETKKLRNLEILKLSFNKNSFTWDQAFSLKDLDGIASPHHETPFVRNLKP